MDGKLVSFFKFLGKKEICLYLVNKNFLDYTQILSGKTFVGGKVTKFFPDKVYEQKWKILNQKRLAHQKGSNLCLNFLSKDSAI